MKKIAEKQIPPTPMHFEGSWGVRPAGTHASTMTLYFNDGRAGSGFIEWDIPTLETTETIGLTWDNDKNLLDYDGVFAIPAPAVEFLREQGFTVSEDFEV